MTFHYCLQVKVPVPENARRPDMAAVREPDDSVEPAMASDITPSTDPGAELALKNAGLLPFHPKLKGNVTQGTGGQADYGTHKDKLFKRVSIKEDVAGGPTGGGVADYGNKKPIDIVKSEGPGDVIIPAGYADYGIPKLEVDVSFNKVGQSVVCHFPSPLWQGTGANPYTVRCPTLRLPAVRLLLTTLHSLQASSKQVYPSGPCGYQHCNIVFSDRAWLGCVSVGSR